MLGFFSLAFFIYLFWKQLICKWQLSIIILLFIDAYNLKYNFQNILNKFSKHAVSLVNNNFVVFLIANERILIFRIVIRVQLVYT